MKKAELFFALLILIGLFLLSMQLPGADALLIISFSSLAMIYYGAFLIFNEIRLRDIFKKEAYAHTSIKKIIGSIGLGLALAMLLIAILFKIEIWPGGLFMFYVGLSLTSLILLIAFIINRGKKSRFFNAIYKRGLIIGIAGFFVYQIPKDTLIDWRFKDKPEYAKLLKEFHKNPNQDENFLKRLDEAYEKGN